MNDIVKNKLLEVVKKYGTSIINDEKKIKAILLDLLKNEHKSEINLIAVAVEENIPTELHEGLVPVEISVPRFVEKLMTERKINIDAAEWTVCTWAHALEINIALNPKFKSDKMEVILPKPEFFIDDFDIDLEEDSILEETENSVECPFCKEENDLSNFSGKFLESKCKSCHKYIFSPDGRNFSNFINKIMIGDTSLIRKIANDESIDNRRKISFSNSKGYLMVFVIFIVSFTAYIYNISDLRNWEDEFLYASWGAVTSYFLVRVIQVLVGFFRYNNQYIFYDNKYLMSVKPDIIQYASIESFKDIDITSGGENEIRVSFIFNNIPTISITISKYYIKEFQEFSNSFLLQKSFLELDPDSENIHVPKTSYILNFAKKRYLALFTLIISYIFLNLIIVPRVIDLNMFNTAKLGGDSESWRVYVNEKRNIYHHQEAAIALDKALFQEANQVNTATAYRNYLSDNASINFREKAKDNIKVIYNSQINKYRGLSKSSKNAVFLVKVIEYMRNQDISNVKFTFNFKRDFNRNVYTKVSSLLPRLVSAKDSFTDEKNRAREGEIIDTIKDSFSKIFPTDIFSVNQDGNPKLIPNFVVNYTYKNEFNAYTLKKEDHLPAKNKIAFESISIHWNFKMYIPNSKKELYSFEFNSVPLPNFTAKTNDPDDVYSNMIETTFYSFRKEFSKKFSIK